MAELRCCLCCGRDTRNKSQICTHCNKDRREAEKDLPRHHDGHCWWLDEEDQVEPDPVDVEWLIDESE